MNQHHQQGRDAPPAAPAATDPPGHEAGRSRREYGHSSGDRNSRSNDDQWNEFQGGEQREGSPDADKA